MVSGGARVGLKLLVGLVWLLSWLPFRVISALGWLLGSLIYLLPTSCRHIGEVNLRLCLPELSAAERSQLLRRHFVAMVQMLLEYGYCWFASRARGRRTATLPGWTRSTCVHHRSRGRSSC